MAQAVENRGPVVLTITIVFLVLSTAVVTLRLVSRIGIVKKFHWEDGFIVLAWMIAFGFSFTIFWGVHHGLGLHESDIPEGSQVPLRKSIYAFSVLYNPVLMATKTSILLFYLTLSETRRVFRWATYATLFAVNVAGLGLTILNIAQCNPVWSVFDAVTPAYATCKDLVTLYLSSSPVNVSTDLAILFIPIPILTGMRLPRKQKIILVITFSFGAFVAVVDVVRLAYLQQAFQARVSEQTSAASSNQSEFGDFSWYASLSFMWSAIEVQVGIICACVPSLKPLVSRIVPSLLRNTDDPLDVSHIYRSPTASAAAKPRNNGLPIPPSHGNRKEERDSEMGFPAFLTLPDAVSQRTTTRGTLNTATTRSRTESFSFFDFYNIKTIKPMTKFTNKESYFPLALVTILFFMWGFAYGLLDVLNSQFQQVVNANMVQSLGLHAAYFGGYFIGPLTFGRIVFKTWGFKATFITGLCIYGVGTLVFWPSAVLTSFPAFLISNLIVGLGVSTLEVAANPFIAMCGPPEYAEVRLNLSQGVQAIGSVLSSLLAKKVLFKDVTSHASLIDVQWTYLGIALFDVFLAIAFYYFPIPEATDEDFEEVAEKRSSINSRKLCGYPIIYITLALGVFSQFCYVGGQEAASVVFQNYISSVDRGATIDPFSYQTVGSSIFAAGRFLCAFAGFLFKPRWILLFLFAGLITTAALAMALSGPAGTAMIVLFQLFQSGTFPLIYAIALRGLGAGTKSGAIYLTAAISGGAVFPVLSAVATAARGVQYLYAVIVATSAAGAVFPLYLCCVGPAKAQVDPIHRRGHGRGCGHDGGKRHPVLQEGGGRAEKKGGWGLGGVVWKKKRSSRKGPGVEHIEKPRAVGGEAEEPA